MAKFKKDGATTIKTNETNEIEFLQDLKLFNDKLGAQKPRNYTVTDLNASIEEQKKIMAVPPEKRSEPSLIDKVSGNTGGYNPRGGRNLDTSP